MISFGTLAGILDAAASGILTRDVAGTLALGLSLVLLWSGVAKLKAPDRLAQAITDFGVTKTAYVRLAIAVALFEVTLGIALTVSSALLPGVRLPALSIATLTFGLFAGLIARSLHRGHDFACFCFGEATPISRSTLWRAGALAATAAVSTAGTAVDSAPPVAGEFVARAAVASAAVGVISLTALIPGILARTREALLSFGPVVTETRGMGE